MIFIIPNVDFWPLTLITAELSWGYLLTNDIHLVMEKCEYRFLFLSVMCDVVFCKEHDRHFQSSIFHIYYQKHLQLYFLRFK